MSTYKTLKLSALLADPNDNPRVDYSALPQIQAKIEEQGFDDSFPIQVTKLREKGPNGETHKVTGGFTRHKAATALKLDEVPCVVTDYSPIEVLRNHLTSNAGNPLTQHEQGKVFVQIRDYGTDPATLGKGEEVREKPMTTAEIARATGYSGEHVRNCIMIAEAPKEIRELLEQGKVSANAVVDASKGVKEPKTIRKILEAAVEAASGSLATNKHVKEVKARFVEPKLLKGRTAKEQAAPVAKHDIDKGDAVTVNDGIAERLTIPNPSSPVTVSEETEIKAPAHRTPLPEISLIDSPSPKLDQIILIITDASNEKDMDLDDDEIEFLAGKLVEVF